MYKKIFFFVLVNLVTFSSLAEPGTYQITAEQWATPRHGERVLEFPAIRQLIEEWSSNPGQKIEISYPGGENGELWVQEMKDWLIALGVSSSNILTLAGSRASDILELSVVKAGGSK